MKTKTRNILIFLGLTTAVVGGAGWYFLSGDKAQLDIAQVSGPSPEITAPRKEIFPTINVADVKPWGPNEAPKAAEGLQVARFADERCWHLPVEASLEPDIIPGVVAALQSLSPSLK